jgi:hypothetical protein
MKSAYVTLSRVDPMAKTYAYATGGGSIATLTVSGTERMLRPNLAFIGL